MFKKIAIIVNPIAGGAKSKEKIIDYLFRYFSSLCKDMAIQITSQPGEATALARKCAQEKVELIIAIGGDGTINEVGTGLVGTEVALAIIPTGSGNGLARSLNIPTNLRHACELIKQQTVTYIDVGQANNRYFFLVFGLGFDAVVGKRFSESSLRGPIPYFYYSFKEYFEYRPPKMEIVFNGYAKKIQPFVVAVANGKQYGNGALIAPDAKLNDGFFDVCIVHRLTVFQAFTAIPKLFKGKIHNFHEVEFHKTDALQIVRDEPGIINIDGEPIEEGATINIKILPKKLKIIAPGNNPALI